MNLANKTFRNLINGEDIKIIDVLGDFAVSTNGLKIKTSNLLDSNQYIEKIDPNSFLSSHHTELQNLAQKIIESDTYQNSGSNTHENDSAIIITSLEEEQEELARKYGIKNNNTQSDIQKQNEAFDKILNPVKKNTDEQKSQNRYVEPEKIKEIEDPIYLIFKNTKRNLEFNIDFSISEKIPRIDFIEMMEDSYETSIIDFLAKEFTNKLIKDPSVIQGMVSEKIREIVYKKNKPKAKEIVKEPIKTPIKTTSKRTRRPTIKKEEKND
jgi:hypothetical protein